VLERGRIDSRTREVEELDVSSSPPSSPHTISVTSRKRRMRAPGLGIGIPIASYSGSYQPAPRPMSSRPPVTRSSVASALASTPGGRSASQITSVPSRTWVTAAARAPSVAIGSNAPYRRSSPPYFAMSRNKWSDSHSESNPSASARRACSTIVVSSNGDSPATE